MPTGWPPGPSWPGCDLIRCGTDGRRRRDPRHRRRPAAAGRRGHRRRRGADRRARPAQGPDRGRRRAQRRRAGRRRDRRRDQRRGRDAPGPGARPGHGRRRRRRADRHDRRARRGQEPEVLAAIEAHGLTPANVNGGGPDRRRRHDGAAGRVRGRPARRGPAAAAVGGRAPSTPATWPRPSRPWPPRPPRCRPATRSCRCCPTGTARPCESGSGLAGADHRPGQRAGPVGQCMAGHGRGAAPPR